MTRKLTVHLTDAALASVRPGDSLSRRLNQMAARYASIIGALAPQVAARFDPRERASIVDACALHAPRHIAGTNCVAGALRATGLAADDPRLRKLAELGAAESVALIELIEAGEL
jgi:hypothetical protein